MKEFRCFKIEMKARPCSAVLPCSLYFFQRCFDRRKKVLEEKWFLNISVSLKPLSREGSTCFDAILYIGLSLGLAGSVLIT